MKARGFRIKPSCAALMVSAILLLMAVQISVAQEVTRERPREPRFLFVCAGDQARTNPDFLAVVNFDQDSRDYGKVIATSPLPEPGATGNEFHHIGLSVDDKVVACGGLLSVLKGQKEVFFWDVSDPAAPKFITSADPPLSAITDEFYALPEGGFLVTMMGGAKGHAPGRVAEFDRRLNLVREHPENPPEDGFNPHGIAVRPEINLMVTSDFVCPSTTLVLTCINQSNVSLALRRTPPPWSIQMVQRFPGRLSRTDQSLPAIGAPGCN
jgi:selenium-binding protein 1